MQSIGFDNTSKGVVALSGDVARVTVNGRDWAPRRHLLEFQSGVAAWMRECFGPDIAADMLERADRFVEEALELAQTMPGFGPERAHALVDYVFNRPPGERRQEVGGVMVTLAALCNAADLSMAAEGDRELARVWTKVDAIRAKQAAKPTGSALPVAEPTPDAWLYENKWELVKEEAPRPDLVEAGYSETPLFYGRRVAHV